MSTESPDPSDMSREALEAELTERRQQPEMEFRGEKKIENLWIGGLPVGKKIMGNGEKADEALDVAVDNTPVDIDSDAARGIKITIHRRLSDLLIGDGEEMNKCTRRGAWLFQRFIHKFDSEKELVGVESGHGRLRMVSDRAKKVLEDNGVSDPASNDVKRAMKAVVDRSKPADGEDPMFDFKAGRPYTLSVDQEAFERYLSRIESELKDSVSTTADDGGNSPEATADAQAVDEEFARLEQARPDGGDEKTDTVVSNSQESLSEGGENSSDRSTTR